MLDVGCGTGNLLRSAGERHRGVELVGLDPDPKALARAGRKARRAGLAMRLDRGFAQELPHPDGSFDRVFSSLMLHHLDGPAKDELLTEVRRVPRPDGLLVLADIVVDEHGHGLGHRRAGSHGRMHEQLRDNVVTPCGSGSPRPASPWSRPGRSRCGSAGGSASNRPGRARPGSSRPSRACRPPGGSAPCRRRKGATRSGKVA